MKEQILKLREQGKSYREIQSELGCSRGTISYHCGIGQKEKQTERHRKNNSHRSLLNKVGNFKKSTSRDKRSRRKSDEEIKSTTQQQIFAKTREFQNKGNDFNYKDIFDKVGENPKCYLTGRMIDLTKPRTYAFDHIIPRSKGGLNALENLGLTCRSANMAKSDLEVDEFVQLCIDVVKNFGYEVTR
jgi:5-methylcytosine-specific restriction endonuclease McrA